MQLGPYNLRERLGHGGMATVWSGIHTTLGTPVAFKFLRPETGADNPERVARFLDETRALARMRHPGIVSIFDAGLADEQVAAHVGDTMAGAPYFVMEAVGGGTLEARPIRSWATCRSVLLGLLDALAHAHARDVVHRDLKPSNVLVDEFGRLRLTDFGIARLQERHVRLERVTGTPHYMAPEQVAGEVAREGPWTDLYALGCLAFWITTGAPPFRGSIEDVLAAHMDEPVPSLSPRFDVPDRFADWCQVMLAKDPQARFMRASDAAGVLAGFADTVETSAAEFDEEPIEVAHTTILSEEKSPADRPVAAGTSTDHFEPPPPPSTWARPAIPTRDLAMLSSARLVALREPMFRGRTAERSVLWEALCNAWTSPCTVVLAIQGVHGTGQRALIRWFARRAHETGSAHLLVFDEDVEASLQRQLVRWFRSVGGIPGATAFYAARGELDELAEWDISKVASWVDGAKAHRAVLDAVHARWTARLSADRVALYVGEAEAVADVVRTSARVAEGRRLGVYPTTVPTDDPSLVLAPLAVDDIALLVRDLTGVAERTAMRFARAADGNPGAAIGWARLAVRNDLLTESPLGYEVEDADLQGLIASENEHWVDTCGQLEPSVARLAAVAAHASSWLSTSELAVLDESSVVEKALAELSDTGLIAVNEGTVRFAHPGARRALKLGHALTSVDHQRLASAFATAPRTPRRRVIATTSGYLCGALSMTAVIEAAQMLRAEGHLDYARSVLRTMLAEVADTDATTVGIELVECELASQNYSAATELVETLDPGHPNVHALQQHLTLRGLKNVELDELLAIEPNLLSPTAVRMLSYALADFGEFERARAALDLIDFTHDGGGRLYALARLEFIQSNWAEAAAFAEQAVERFEEFSRPDGVAAAQDLLASALLELEDLSALDLYRDNLRTADRLGIPAIASRFNLPLAMLKLDQVSRETELLLERATADALQRGRMDIVHCARAAQVLYAIRVQNESLAADRLATLEGHELGPWVQDDSVLCLERAAEEASAELQPRILALLDEVRSAVG